MKWGVKRKSLEQLPLPLSIREISNALVRLENPSIVGPCIVSSNGKYFLVLGDHNSEGNHGGCREFGLGVFALLDANGVVYQGMCERPIIGAISNTGVVAVIDTLFGMELRSILYVYSNSGNKIVAYEQSANAVGVAISDSGKYVLVEYANCYIDDFKKVHIVEVNTGQKINEFNSVTGHSIEYTIDENLRKIIFENKNNRFYEYSFSGEFNDFERYEIEKVLDADCYEIVHIVKQKLENSEPDAYMEIVNLLDRVFEKKSYKDYDPRAMAYRIRGEVFEILGDLDKTISDYRAAIEINPKIGLKRKLSKLESQINR